MSCKNNQRKDSCVKGYAICIEYNATIPDYSDLAEEPCVSIEEVGEDLYKHVTELREVTDVNKLDFGCLTAPTNPTLLNTIQLLLQEVCTLKELVASQGVDIETLKQEVLELQENPC